MNNLFVWLDSLSLCCFLLIFFVGYVVIDIIMKFKRNKKGVSNENI